MGAMSIVALSAVSIAGYVAALISNGEGSFISTFRHSLFGRIDVVVDDMSGLFLILVSVLFSVGAIYGIGYLNTYDKRVGQTRLHWLTLMLTFVGMVVMMTTDNMIIFLIGWEFMAIGSFFAVIFESEKPLVLKSGLNYFIQSHIAVLMLTGAFVWVYSYSGTTSFEGFKIFMESATAKELCVMMFLLVGGFGFKAGIVPFHSWLPYAHPAAPSHVSALMSGVIVKAGIYGIIRFGSYVRYSAADITTEIGLVILAMGVISGLYGIINAAVHRDFKRMLAYCTIENIGIIVMGIGVGFIGMGESNYFITVMGFGAALLHTINHAIFKSLLFFGAGNVYIMTHTRNMEELGGLIKLMPRTAFVFLIGALAIGGLPPFGGFVSEWILYYSFIKGMTMSDLMIPAAMVVSGACLAVIGGVSMLTFTKSFGVIFLGEPRKMLVHQPHEVKGGMLKTSYILIGLIVMFVLFARQLFEFRHLLSPTYLVCDFSPWRRWR
jgi:formate hydrogenlyase subunit 3/multisubunit Na+/H+ antiporter MnhD subunit